MLINIEGAKDRMIKLYTIVILYLLKKIYNIEWDRAILKGYIKYYIIY